ncbi:hypothetical protein ACQEU6_03515 [Spirillospora sp. CA-108201]
MGIGTEEPRRPWIHPDVRREHVIKLAAVANSRTELVGRLVRPDGELAAEISQAPSGHATEVTVIIYQGVPCFAWAADHEAIAAVEDIAETLTAVRHRLAMQEQT